MKIIIFFIVFFALFFVVRTLLDKLWGKPKKISDTPGKEVDRRGRLIIIIVIMVSFPLVIMYDNDLVFTYYPVVLAFFPMFFYFFLACKYLRETKEHLKAIVYMMLFIIAFISANSFFS